MDRQMGKARGWIETERQTRGWIQTGRQTRGWIQTGRQIFKEISKNGKLPQLQYCGEMFLQFGGDRANSMTCIYCTLAGKQREKFIINIVDDRHPILSYIFILLQLTTYYHRRNMLGFSVCVVFHLARLRAGLFLIPRRKCANWHSWAHLPQFR